MAAFKLGLTKASYCSTASSPSNNTKPPPTKAKAGNNSPTPSSAPSTSNAKISSFYSGAATPSKKGSLSIDNVTSSSPHPTHHRYPPIAASSVTSISPKPMPIYKKTALSQFLGRCKSLLTIVIFATQDLDKVKILLSQRKL